MKIVKNIKIYKKIIIIFLIIFVFLSFFTNNIYATNITFDNTNSSNSTNLENKDTLDIYAKACCLIDVDANEILYEKNSNEILYPASTTKLLTAIVVLENVKDLSEKAKVSYYAVHSVPYSYSIASLVPNEEISISDLLKTLLIASANDSAFVLAEYVANKGNNYQLDQSQNSHSKFEESIATFSTLMNNKAKELGCLNSNFVNPNGIQNENHYSTAFDLAQIGKYAYNNSEIMYLASLKTFTLANDEYYNKDLRTFNSTNILLNPNKKLYYPYANGLKTGYTDSAKFCIIASAQKDDRNLIAVVLNSDNATDITTSREADCIRLFEYGFNNFQNMYVAKQGDSIRTINIINGTSKTKTMNLICENDIKILLIKGEAIDITPKISINKYLAPISKNEVIGTITYTFNNKEYSSNLLAQIDVYASANMFYIIFAILIIITIIILLTIFFNKKTDSFKPIKSFKKKSKL